jgi:hypothetical protein
MTITGNGPRTWRFPSMMLRGHIAFGSLMWVGLVVLTLAITVALDRFTEVSDSTWEQSSQVVSWYVGGVCWYIAYQVVPMLIAHGRTRRDTAIEVAIFMVIFAAVAAVLVAAGYLIEYAVYGFAGWPRDLSGNQTFDSHLDVVRIVLQSWLVAIVWAAAGAFVGSAFYRSPDAGWFALFPASILIGLVGTFTNGFWGPVGFFIERFLPVETPSLALAIPTAIACLLIALALTWPIVRDLPIRNR